MFEQDVVENGPFHGEGLGFTREFAGAEKEPIRTRAIAEKKLRGELARKTGRFNGGQHAQFAEDGPIIRQKRFANMEARAR